MKVKPFGYISDRDYETFNTCEADLFKRRFLPTDVPLVILTPALQELVEAACEWNALLEKADECTGSFELTPEQEDTFLKLDTSAMRLRKAAKAFKDGSK